MLRTHHNDLPAPLEFAHQVQPSFRQQLFAPVMRRHGLLWVALLVCIAGLNAVPAFAQGIITTVSGNGERGFWGNGGQATRTPLNLGRETGGVAVDLAGNLYIADTGSHRVYKVSSGGQRLTVAGSDCWVCAPEEQLAGEPQAGFSGDGGQAFNALLNSPTGVGVDTVGNLYIVDTGNQRIRKVDLQGIITTVAGNGVRGFSGDGGPAINASLNLATSWVPTRYSGDVAADAAGNLYIADTGNSRIRKVTPDGTITSVAYFGDPWSVAVDLAGNLYIAENTPHLGGAVHKLTSDGTLTTIAGSRNEPVPGSFGPFGDGGLATNAWLLFCTGVAVDAFGNVYIADSGARRIRKVDSEGKIATVAGSGNPVFTPPDPIFGEGGGYYIQGGFSGDDGLSTNAQLNAPWGVAVDAARNVYIADSLNNRIRKVTAAGNDNQGTFTSPFPFLLYGPFESDTSAITVSGLAGTVSKVTATITFGDHAAPPADLAFLLVGPNGQSSILMSGVGVDKPFRLTLTFDDAAPSSLTNNPASGIYKPSPLRPVTFPPPAPTDRPYGTTLSVFNGAGPNGEWKLYAVNFVNDSACSIFGENCTVVGGWSLTITTTPALPNRIDDAQFFVRQQYLDFLNREPDADGLNFWTNEITSCGGDAQCIDAKRINVSAAYFLSIEFQQTGYLAYRIFKTSFGNLPGMPVPIKLSEFLPDTQQIGQGLIVNQPGWEQLLENNKQAFSTQFVQRSRFTSVYPTSLTPAQFVDQLFMNAGVTPSATDRTAAINEFGSATTTADTAARARALRRVAENSTFAEQEFNRAFVLMQYFGYLRRNPDDAPDGNMSGFNFWLNKLNQFNGNFVSAEMVKAFIQSTEYRNRFAPK